MRIENVESSTTVTVKMTYSNTTIQKAKVDICTKQMAKKRSSKLDKYLQFEGIC